MVADQLNSLYGKGRRAEKVLLETYKFTTISFKIPIFFITFQLFIL